MKKQYLLFSILILLVFTSLLSAQQGRPGGGGGGGGRPSGTAGREGTKPVGETEISLRSNYIAVAGRLEPRSRIVHKASVAGLVGEVNVKEGDYVRVGDHLFRIDGNDVGQSFKPVYVDARIAGIVSQINVQINSDISSGTPAVTIVATDSYTVEAVISDKDAFKITVGQRVTGHNPEGLEIIGTLTGRSQEPDYSTGLFNLNFNFPAKKGFFIGSFILIQLPTDQKKGIFINRDLLIRRYGGYFLWVIDSGNKLTAREVEPGAAFGDDIHIVSGLEPGEKYLTILSGKETEGMEFGRGKS